MYATSLSCESACTCDQRSRAETLPMIESPWPRRPFVFTTAAAASADSRVLSLLPPVARTITAKSSCGFARMAARSGGLILVSSLFASTLAPSAVMRRTAASDAAVQRFNATPPCCNAPPARPIRALTTPSGAVASAFSRGTSRCFGHCAVRSARICHRDACRRDALSACSRHEGRLVRLASMNSGPASPRRPAPAGPIVTRVGSRRSTRTAART